MEWDDYEKLKQLAASQAAMEVRKIVLNGITNRTDTLDISEFRIDVLPLELERFQTLLFLNCSATNISEILAISNLNNLESLNCSNTPVHNLNPISKNENLTTINIRNTAFKDLVPIVSHKSLERLFANNLRQCPVPAENLSSFYGENCLPRVRSWYTNQQQGSEPFRQHKLFLLGNGTVGKTQVARALMGEGYDARIASTHGIQIHTHPLPAPADTRHADAGEAFAAKIWDFGGQDIYHGTHSLFLKTRAIFLICWERESEQSREHRIDGVPYRNRPLAYWLDYVRQFAGPDAQVILVQTKADKPGSAADAAETANRYPDLPACSTSALDGEGFHRLKRLIAQAVGRIEAPALPIIPTSQRRVIDAITALREAGIHTLDQQAFADLCADAGLIGAPEHMLHFLHHAGEVFHTRDTFGGQIIIDQRWALDAIYAVFDRDQCWQAIRAERGRFTLTTLSETVWQAFSDGDRQHLLSMMLRCGMAFRYIEVEQTGQEAVYIAPDLLPDRSETSVTRWVRRYWDGSAPCHRRTIAFDLLHDGLMREIMRSIGQDAGLHAVNWKNGLLFFDGEAGALAIIEARWPEAHGWAGEIVITTQRGGAQGLAQRLERHVLGVAQRMGLSQSSALSAPQPDDFTPQTNFEPIADRAPPRPPRDTGSGEQQQPFTPAAAQPLRPVCYVSYTRQDQRHGIAGDEHLVEDLKREAQAREIDLITYEDHIVMGDTITGFTEEIARAQIVAALIGQHYLQRPHCFHELISCWAESTLDSKQFSRKMRPVPFPGADIYPDHQRGDGRMASRVATYWADRYDQCHALDDRDLEEDLIAKFGKRWATETPFILRELQNMIANYRDFDDYKRQLFAELESMRYHGPGS